MKLHDLVKWYNHLTPQTLSNLPSLYHETARFRDPFNDVQGHDSIRAVFEHMFEQCKNPVFLVLDTQVEGSVAWVTWHFKLEMRGKPLEIPGTTRLEFGRDGRVTDHRDYWDSADLYAELPLIGGLIRYLRGKLRLSGRRNSGN